MLTFVFTSSVTEPQTVISLVKRLFLTRPSGYWWRFSLAYCASSWERKWSSCMPATISSLFTCGGSLWAHHSKANRQDGLRSDGYRSLLEKLEAMTQQNEQFLNDWKCSALLCSLLYLRGSVAFIWTSFSENNSPPIWFYRYWMIAWKLQLQ